MTAAPGAPRGEEQRVPDEPENPIVALAAKIRARAQIERTAEAADEPGTQRDALDAAAQLAAFAAGLHGGARKLNSILGRDGVTVVRLERPLRVRVRFRDKRVTFDVDEARQLILVSGEGFDGEYQFSESAVPSLINLSKLSTEDGYRDPLTPSVLLKRLTEDAQLPRPAHLDEGPLKF